MTKKQNPVLQPVSVATTKKEIIEDLRDKVADIKYDCQVVLDILDSLYHEYDEDE
jgi:hypothetical protein